MKKKKDKSVYGVVLVLAFFAIAAMYYTSSNIKYQINDVIVRIPVIKSVINSKTSDGTHDVKIGVAIDITKKDKNKLDQNALYSQVNEIVSNLDYDELIKKEGFSYLVDKIRTELDIDYANGIYISEFQVDNLTPMEDTTKRNSRDENLKAITKFR